MRTYRTLQEQIAQLQEQAEALRAKEVHDVIGRIREAIDIYGLTAADLGLDADRKSGKRPRATQLARSVSPPMYRDPKSGKTWSGRGRVPNWMAKARDRTRFLIEAQEAASAELPSQVADAAAKRKRPAQSKAATTDGKAAGKTVGPRDMKASKRQSARIGGRRAATHATSVTEADAGVSDAAAQQQVAAAAGGAVDAA